jgi:hypothetical protein
MAKEVGSSLFSEGDGLFQRSLIAPKSAESSEFSRPHRGNASYQGTTFGRAVQIK